MKTFAELRKPRGMSRSNIAAVLIIFVISLSLYYNEYFLNPFVSHLDHIEDLSDKSGEIPDLAIRLHPGDHEAREHGIIEYQLLVDEACWGQMKACLTGKAFLARIVAGYACCSTAIAGA